MAAVTQHAKLISSGRPPLKQTWKFMHLTDEVTVAVFRSVISPSPREHCCHAPHIKLALLFFESPAPGCRLRQLYYALRTRHL